MQKTLQGVCIIVLFLFSPLNAQQWINPIPEACAEIHYGNGVPEYIRFNAPIQNTDDAAFLLNLFTLPESYSLIKTQSFRDELGMLHERYQLYQGGIEILGSVLIIHRNASGIVSG